MHANIETPPIRQVEKELLAMKDTLEELHQAITELENRLMPVININIAQSPDGLPEKEGAPVVPLAAEMSDNRRKARSARSKIIHILEHLEL